jgi:endonuclease YncB( thermonuclease family)
MPDATTYLYKITPGAVHDGDTLWVTIDLGFYLAHTVKIRLAGINAPELATPAGAPARDALIAFITTHPGQWTARTYKSGEEKYGRWLATLYAPDGTDVCAWMLTNGYAIPDTTGVSTP